MIGSSAIFEGIAAVSQLGMAIVVGFGVHIAFRQLSSWRDEKSAVVKADLAEQMLVLMNEIREEFEQIRSAWGAGDPDGKDDNGRYDLNRRLSKLIAMDDQFLRLRRLEVRARIHKFSTVGRLAGELRDARAKLYVAITGLLRSSQQGGVASTNAQSNRLEKHTDLVYSNYENSDDPINEPLDDLMLLVENELSKYVNFG